MLLYMKKGLCALALGTFGLGVAEFVMMGILPDIASDMNISITQAGHFISAYALGVCTGAPLIAIIAKDWPLRKILVALMIIFVIGNTLISAFPNYWIALFARFITGLPHGSFFGVGAIVANRLAKEGKGTSAVSMMVMGMTIANLVGVPICNFLGHHYSWRLIFIFAAVWGVVTIFFIQRWIPELSPLPKTKIKGMFAFLKHPEPWLLLIATALANGGVFCWYSYVNPLMTDVSGFKAEMIPFLMVLSGASMCLGNYLGGFLSDRSSPGTVAMYTQGVIFISLALIFLFASNPFASVVLMCITTGCLFAVSSPQQQLLLQHSKGGEIMGGAMVQLAFNMGNAIGAFAGGLVLKKNIGIEYTAITGSVFALLGMLMLVWFNYASRIKSSINHRL